MTSKKADKINTKERIKKRDYRPVPPSDTIEVNYYRDGKLVHRNISKSKDKTVLSNVVEYQNVNEDKIVIFKIPFFHIGTLSVFYYKDNPEVCYIGTGKNYDRIDAYEVKKLWGGAMKLANHLDIIGAYSDGALEKRFPEKYKKSRK